MKKKSERLAPVLKLKNMHEQEAVKHYAQARSQLAQEQNKLEQLVEYRKEYQSMVERKGREGISANRLHALHRFVHKLNNAISQQQEQLSLVQQETLAKEKNWLVRRGAAKNMAKLVARHAQSEQRESDRKEQRTLDEQTLQGFHRQY